MLSFSVNGEVFHILAIVNNEEINSNTIIAGNFNISLASMYRLFRQIINKETSAYTLDQMYLIDIYRTFSSKSNRIYTVLKCTWNVFQYTSQVRLQNKSVNLRGLKMSSIFSNHNVITPEINYMKKVGKFTSTWAWNNMLLSNMLLEFDQWIKEEIKRKVIKYIKTKKSENVTC